MPVIIVSVYGDLIYDIAFLNGLFLRWKYNNLYETERLCVGLVVVTLLDFRCFYTRDDEAVIGCKA